MRHRILEPVEDTRTKVHGVCPRRRCGVTFRDSSEAAVDRAITTHLSDEHRLLHRVLVIVAAVLGVSGGVTLAVIFVPRFFN